MEGSQEVVMFEQALWASLVTWPRHGRWMPQPWANQVISVSQAKSPDSLPHPHITYLPAPCP